MVPSLYSVHSQTLVIAGHFDRISFTLCLFLLLFGIFWWLNLFSAGRSLDGWSANKPAKNGKTHVFKQPSPPNPNVFSFSQKQKVKYGLTRPKQTPSWFLDDTVWCLGTFSSASSPLWFSLSPPRWFQRWSPRSHVHTHTSGLEWDKRRGGIPQQWLSAIPITSVCRGSVGKLLTVGGEKCCKWLREASERQTHLSRWHLPKKGRRNSLNFKLRSEILSE